MNEKTRLVLRDMGKVKITAMSQKLPEGQSALSESVLKKGLCVACGACVDLCPYFNYFDGRVILMDQCRAGEGRCFKWCPRAGEKIHSEENASPGLKGIGPFREIFAARSCDKAKRALAQNGGVVTSLIETALEGGLITSAIMTDRGEDSAPKGTRIDSPDQAKAFSGSRYSASASLSALNRAVNEGRKKIGVAGLPCQMEALEKGGRDLAQNGIKDPVVLRIGLFCTWALDYRKLSKYLEEKGIEGPVLKCDIPPPPAEIFRVYTKEGPFDYPLSDIRKMIQKGCSVCTDMTALHADISVGAFEGREGWNTVIVRTETGEKLLEQAVLNGKIETEPFPEENLFGLNRSALNKKNRGTAVYREWIGGETRE